MISLSKYILAIFTICLLSFNLTAKDMTGLISGKVLSADGEPIDYANVYLKGSVRNKHLNIPVAAGGKNKYVKPQVTHHQKLSAFQL